MKSFKELNISIKVAIFTYIITIIGFLATSFLFFKNMMDVPLGILLGGVVSGTLSLVSYFLNKKDEGSESAKYSILFIIIRFTFLAGLLVLIALMNYLWGLKIFNIFSFVATYTVSIIVMAVIYLKNK